MLRLWLTSMFLLVACCHGGAPYQNRAIFWEPAVDDPGKTVYSFDDGDADGRFGKGKRLDDATTFTGACEIRNGTIAFSIHLDSLPAERAQLVALNGGGKPLIVELDHEGRLHLDAYGVRQATTEPLVKAGRWLHVALLTGAAYRNNAWQGDVELQVDGETLVRMTNTPQLVNQTLKQFQIGPRLVGVIDDARSLPAATSFYAWQRDWVDPEKAVELHVAERDQMLHWPCDEVVLQYPLSGVTGAAFRDAPGARPLSESITVPRAGTLSFWMRPIDWDNRQQASRANIEQAPLFGLGDVLSVGAFIHPSETRADIEPLTPGRWTHVAVSWQGDEVLTYVDGVASDASGFRIEYLPENVEQNATLTTESHTEVSTALDDIRLFRRALSPQEVRQLVATVNRMVPMPKADSVEIRVEANGVVGQLTAWIWPTGLEDVTTGQLVLRHKDQVLASQELSMIPGRYTQIELQTGPLPFGDFEVAVIGDGVDGRARFTRTIPPWYDNDLGISDTVMPGWTPIKLDGNTASIIRRDIQLGGSGFPDQVISAGKPILAGPVSLTATTDLRPGKLAIQSHTPTRLDWSGELIADTWRAEVTGYLEFDGMIWFDVTLKPTGETATIDALTLTIPYNENASDLYHWWSGDMKFAPDRTFRHLTTTNTGGSLPEGEGVLFRSNDAEAVFLPPELRGSFVPYMMITGMERGMAWFAESDRGWTQSSEIPAVAVERKGDTVSTVLRIISEPVTLDAPRTFSFGLHPIPVKELPDNWRMNAGLVTYPDGQTGNSLKGPTKTTHFDQLPLDEDWDAVKARAYGTDSPDAFAGRMWHDYQGEIERFKAFWGRDPGHLEVTVPGIYLNQAWIGRLPAHTAEWEPEFYRRPWVTYTDDFQDYAAWALTQWIEQTDGFIRGTYVDDTWPSPQLEGPCTYTLADGHVQPGWQWRAYRERYKRMRQIFLDHGIEPQLIAHHTNTYYIPYLSFFDVVYDGEWLYSKHPDTNTFLDRWKLDRLRYANHEKWGIITTWLGWGGAPEATSRRQNPEWGYRMDRAYAAALALHDIKWRFNTDNIYDRPSDFHREFGLREPDTVFIPYWHDGGLAAHRHPKLKISAWRRPGKCLVLLVNSDDKEIDATVKLSVEAMGLTGMVTVRDVDPTLTRSFETEKPEPKDDLMSMLEGDVEEDTVNKDAVFTWENGTLSCPVRSDDFRLLLFEETP